MAANSYNFGVNLKINADTQLARQQLGSLQQQLATISNMKVNFSGINALTSEINKASTAALTLQQNLTAALNPATGNLNFSKFNAAIQHSGQTVDGLAQSLLGIGPQGNKAFMQLANSVARAEVPVLRTSAAVNGLWDNLKKTAGWQLSSSMIHGFIGGVQQAVGYAKALDQSLTNIRIVTGQSSEQMAKFAKEANIAAKRLSTTTTDYTNASLIYYQQGLSAAEVKKRADVTLKMANVSGQSAEKVADQMTSIWNNFDDGTKSMEHYADVMTALGAATASSSQEIAKGIQKFSAISETVGLSYEYAASALATITATTRESADTVGNSLKTLFSRIQGLQLGDTLDDGTTLNKYSTALAKVGISIKDASGALKDMDTILDDMGSKWHTLAEDQKMALAQTVGGVRQYTQIMTLMENWDFFKSNLNVAQSSAGTLQKQMDIFEDSWQGAQKKMKASWEGLWDTILDSEGFKKILNVGSTIVDSITKAFQGLGGMGGMFSGGVLGLITSSLGTLFTPQISHGVDSLLYNMGQLLPGARGRAEFARQSTIRSMVDTIMDKGQTPYMTDRQRETAAKNLQNLSQERSIYYQRQQYLTQDQQNAYSILDSQLATIRARQEETARALDENEANRARYAVGSGKKFNYTDPFKFNQPSKKNEYSYRLWQAMFGQTGIKGSQYEGQTLDSILKLGSDLGLRSSEALREIATMTDDLKSGIRSPSQGEADLGQERGEFHIKDLLSQSDITGQRVSGTAFDTLAKFWGVSQDKDLMKAIQVHGFKYITDNPKDKATGQAIFTPQQIALSHQLEKSVNKVQTAIDANKSTPLPTQASAVKTAMDAIIEKGKTDFVTTVGKFDGIDAKQVSGIVTSSENLATLSYLRERDAKNEERIKKEQEALLRQQQSVGSLMVNAGMGISSTMTAMSSIQGAMDSFKSGNTAGGIAGLSSTFLSLGMGNRALTQFASGLGGRIANATSVDQEILEKQRIALLNKKADYETKAEGLKDNKSLIGKAKYKFYNRAGQSTEARAAELGKLQQDPNAQSGFRRTANATGIFIDKNATAIATGVQVGLTAYTAIKKVLDHVADTNKRAAEAASASTSQLQAAYQMNKNNQAALVASVEDYSQATEKLTDTNLKGAEKIAAVFEQNTKVLDLISKYEIDEQYVTRVGDTLHIDEGILRDKEEELIERTQISKYAAEQAKIQANEKKRKLDEETLERKMGADETGLFGWGAGVAGVGAGLLTAALLLSNPVGWLTAGTLAIAGGIGLATGAGLINEGLSRRNERNDSLIDAILEESKLRDGVSWLDDLQVGDTVGNKVIKDEDQLEQIQENKKEIEDLYKNEKYSEQQEKRSQESIARDILKNNDRTEYFKYSNLLEAGLVEQQSHWYNKDKLIDYTKKKSAETIADAQSVEEALGLSGKNVVWTNDKESERLTYTYTDENGNQQTGEFEYTSLANLKATEKGKEDATKYIGKTLEQYDYLKGAVNKYYQDNPPAETTEEELNAKIEDTTAGLLAYAIEGNFDSATLGQMRAAQGYIKSLDLDNSDGTYDYEALAKMLNLDTSGGAEQALKDYAYKHGFTTTEQFGYYNQTREVGDVSKLLAHLEDPSTYTSDIETLMTKYAGGTDVDGKSVTGLYETWFSGSGKNIYGSMNQSTMKDFYNHLNYIQTTQGKEAGQKYLDSLMGMLEGADPDKIGSIMSSLMALDQTDWNIDDSIVDVMDSFGITIDNTNEHLTNFVDLVRSATNALPNLETEMDSLIKIAGSLENVKIGDTLSDDVIQALKDQKINIDDYVFSTWDGKNIVTQDIEGIRERVQEEINKAYGTYAGIVDKVDNSNLLSGLSESEKGEKLNKIKNLSQSQFESMMQNSDEDIDMGVFVSQVLTNKERDALDANINRKEALMQDIAGYKVEDGVLKRLRKDGSYTAVEAEELSLEDYNKKVAEIESLNQSIGITFGKITSAVDATLDPEAMKTMSEWYVSTFGSYSDAINNPLVQWMIDDEYLNADDLLISIASQYDEMHDDIDAYLAARAAENNELAKSIREDMEAETAMHASISNYQKVTGKKISYAEMEAAKEEIKEDLEKEKITINDKEKTRADLYTDEELTRLAEESLIAGNAKQILKSKGSTWLSQIENMDSDVEGAYSKGLEAAGELGKFLQQYLGLTEYTIRDIGNATKGNPILDILDDIDENVINMSKVLSGDAAEMAKLRVELIKRSTAGQNLTNKLKIGANGKADESYDPNESYNANVSRMKKALAYNAMLGAETDENFNEAAAEYGLFNAENWEDFNTAVSMASKGAQRALKQGTVYTQSTITAGEETKTEYKEHNYRVINNQVLIEKPGESGTYVAPEDAGVTKDNLVAAGVVDEEGNPITTSGGSGGGGGPTKVGVKSAQELMTRYKVIDQKTTISDMQKTAALQAKDLLYGQSKINQLNTINTLLRKQQQLTTDRITEELDYLEKDKQKIEELIERYNKDAKDEDKINLEYDSFGIITNYKQVIGKWAEDIAALYADGELTSEEGKTAEELQKKIQDFNTVIQDYEDSLNQLMTSIETYENTLYEMFSNQMETLTYKVQYKIELEQDDLSYIDFYTSNIKDSYSMMYTYLELIGSKIGKISGQMEIYQGGYEDLINSVEDDPLQLWATQGVEGILTADQIETARSYRDSMISLYQSAVAVRKEIEEQVLRVFEEWNDKINKNVSNISRFTDMLSQFKDIINIVGKDVLGLSDTFMKTFEQKSINQSMDNIAASKSQYENLAKTYEQSQAKLLEARQRLEEAKASGDEGLIATAEKDVEYWEDISDKTQEEMQNAEDAMLTTLNHTLTMISQQFTDAVTEAVDSFNESIYQFNGLEGLVSDYELIKEQQDLMVADYEKIYSLNKLNRNIEKSLNNSNILSGKQKLLGLQKEINELTQNNVELSRYDLEYLQAKYELKLAEMELDNAKNSKDTVRLTRDSEGNWSYIYTQNANAVEEAEQKVEDSLFRMQQLSQQYTQEMSSAMMSITQAMRDEISALNIQDFESPEAFEAEINRIQEKYAAQIAHREEELNKSIANSSALYEQDWANYSAITGYKMSADQDWVDSFNETTLGGLLGSSSDISNYSILIADSTNKMNDALGKAAGIYFVNADKALTTYGSSLKTFGSHVSTTTNNIVSQSTKAVKEVSDMGSKLVTEFETITNKVEEDLAKWAENIGNTLTKLLNQIVKINTTIAESASKNIPETTDMIGQKEAAELLAQAEFNNSKYSGWEWDGNRAIHNGKDIVEFNGELVKDVNAALQAYANTKVGSPEREAAAEELRKVIADYWTFKKILERIYDPTNIDIGKIETPDVTEMATGGYTGEWGNEGKYAVLHEKELVLNKDDTANFLDALNVSKQLIEMIEMNARASSLGLGEMHAATIQDSIQTLEQQVNITAEFPDAVDHNEIKEAFDNLINTASQYANRYRD